MTYPIAVICFNRPETLEPVLDSLLEQRDFQIGRIGLFQDGMHNRHSKRSYGDDAVIARQVAMFQTRFPQGEVFVAAENLGPGVNIARAEDWVFAMLGATAGMFFEDDLVLGPYYLRSLEAMLELPLRGERVSYVACYGVPGTPLAQQQPVGPVYSDYVPMRENWGFGLTREQWLINKPYIDAYTKAMRTCDYRQRFNGEVEREFAKLHVPGFWHTQQDTIRTLCSYRLSRRVKLNTAACLGHMIGVDGMHFDKRRYQRDGHDRTEVYPDAIVDFAPPSEEQFRECAQVEMRWAGCPNSCDSCWLGLVGSEPARPWT